MDFFYEPVTRGTIRVPTRAPAPAVVKSKTVVRGKADTVAAILNRATTIEIYSHHSASERDPLVIAALDMERKLMAAGIEDPFKYINIGSDMIQFKGVVGF